MASYLIVGSGYRSMYFARVAVKHPELFRAMYLCRSAEKAALMRERTGVPATDSLAEALAFGPDYVVVAVDRDHVAEVALEWTERGFPVVTETPVGASWEQLARLREAERRGARIVCCEQYHRHPVLAEGLKLVREGAIGTPASAYLSLMHDYHAFSLIRQMLCAGHEPYTLRAARQVSPVTATDSRCGAILDGSRAEETRDIAHITFASGKTAVYDFSSVQYRSFIRVRHLTVRGDRGEWSDRTVTRVGEDGAPERIFLTGQVAYRALDTQALRDLRKTWTAELALDTEQDEYAIGTMLLDMESYLRGGPSPYPLADAIADAAFWLLMEQAVAAPWQPVTLPEGFR